MTELLEMNALLEKFWNLCPAEWMSVCSSFNEGNKNHFPCIRLDPPVTKVIMHPIYIRPECDMASAEAIVFLWDWLRAKELEVTLLQSYGDGEWICLCQHPFAQTMQHRTAAREEGKTRIEALVRACVAVWRQNEPQEN